jgi:hypothetical protein
MLLFTGAEIWVKLAWCSCSNSWTKPLPVFVKVVEECLTFNFASDPKVQFSLKNLRKTNSKTVQRNTNSPGTPERAHARRRARVPRQRPYARRGRTPRHRRTQRSVRRTGKPLWVTTARSWTAPGGQFPLAGVPTAARHWSSRRRTSQRLAAHAAHAPATWLTPRPPNRP